MTGIAKYSSHEELSRRGICDSQKHFWLKKVCFFFFSVQYKARKLTSVMKISSKYLRTIITVVIPFQVQVITIWRFTNPD